MPVALILDTNVLRQEGLASRNMQLLARLAKSGEIAPYVPEIVRREFLSQRLLEVRDQARKCASAIAEIGKQLGAKNPVQTEIATLKGRLTALEERAVKAIPDEVDQWMTSCRVTQLTFDASDMKGVLNDYFEGTGAFRKAKHRDDIPDAIASASMRPLLQMYEAVHVAIKDGAFKKHLQSEPKYILVDSLDEFFDLGVVKQIVERLDMQEGDVAAVKVFLAGPAFQSRLTAYLRQATNLLEDVYVEKDDLEGTEKMEIEGAYGFSLNYAQAQKISDIQYSEVSYITSGHFSVGVTIRTQARIDLVATFGAFQDLPTTRAVEEWSMDGDGYCDLQEVRDVVLLGHVELLFDPGFGADALLAHTQYLGAPASKIKIELDIQRASIL